MATPLGRSNHPHSLAHTKPIIPKPFPSFSQHPKASSDLPLMPIHPSLPSQQPPTPATTKIFVHVHLRGHPMPVLLLWWPGQPHLAFLCSRIKIRRDRGVGTAKIQQEQRELLCFWVVACRKIMSISPNYCRLMSALHQASPNSNRLLLISYGIAQRAHPSNPSYLASPTAIAAIGL